MKITIDSHGFKNAFELYGRQDQFSHCGKLALFEHLESIEQGTGSDIELDVIGLCCDFTEYATALEAANLYSAFTIDENLNEKEQERQALQFLSDRTTIIPFDGGIIIQDF